MTIGSRIKSERQAAGLTQAELASEIGSKHYQIISQYERGTRTPKYETLEKIATALNIPVAKLLGFTATVKSAHDKGDYDIVADIVKSVAKKNNIPCPDEKADMIALDIVVGLFRGKNLGEIDDYINSNYKELEKYILTELMTIDLTLVASHIQELFQFDMYFWCDDDYAIKLADLLSTALANHKLGDFLELYIQAPENIRVAAMTVLELGTNKKTAPSDAEDGVEDK